MIENEQSYRGSVRERVEKREKVNKGLDPAVSRRVSVRTAVGVRFIKFKSLVWCFFSVSSGLRLV